MTLYSTYAENIRVAAKQLRLSIRDISTQSGYTFEHVRKIWKGTYNLSLSRECNDILCELLGLDSEAMFTMAEQEKFAQKHGYAALPMPDPFGRAMAEVWPSLSDETRAILVKMAQSFATEHVGQFAQAG